MRKLPATFIATFPIELEDGTERDYRVHVEWDGGPAGSYWLLRDISPPVGNKALADDLWERAAGEAQDWLFPGVES